MKSSKCSFRRTKSLLLVTLLGCMSSSVIGQEAQTTKYLSNIKKELTLEWPGNRTINLVFHGHSLPSGYFTAHKVHTFKAYPHQLLRMLKEKYPYAVINSIVTAIGGENSRQGAARFDEQVLSHRPDVLFIDYALNDRQIGPEASRQALESMIKKAMQRDIKVILLTPSPDLRVDPTQPGNELEPYSQVIHELAAKHHVGLTKVYGAFKGIVEQGGNLGDYMSQVNHPNANGHRIIALELVRFF
mgnify:CR=1 FL=1